MILFGVVFAAIIALAVSAAWAVGRREEYDLHHPEPGTDEAGRREQGGH